MPLFGGGGGAAAAPADLGVCTQPAAAADLSLSRLLSNASSLGLAGRAVLALALGSAGAPGAPATASALPANASAVRQDLIQGMLSALRISGQSAYVAGGEGAAGAAGPEPQSLALLALTQASADPSVLQKLATHVAGGPGGSPYTPFATRTSPYAATLATAALAAYDASSGSAQPDVLLDVVNSTGAPLLRARFTLGGEAVARNSTALGGPGAAGNLTFTAAGTGEVSLVAAMRFVPTQLLPYPVSRGLSVQRVIQRTDDSAEDADGGGSDAGDGTGGPVATSASSLGLGVGPPLRRARLSSVVTLTLQVTADDDIDGPVRLEALLPAGLEAIDPNLDTAAGLYQGSSGTVSLLCPARGLGLAEAYREAWRWPICPAQQTRPARVTFEWQRLPAGTQVTALRAVAATPGAFVLPPARVFAVEQPELMGMSAAGAFEVCDGEGCGFEAAEAPAAPRQCPGACSGHGACDASSGVCLCDAGFGGDDCSVYNTETF